MQKVYIPPYIHRIMDYIYLSDHRSKIDMDKFDLVIDLNYPENKVPSGEIEESWIGKTRVLKLGVEESCQENMKSYFDILYPYIHDNVENKKRTLIFSHGGTGRNALVFSSYLIKHYQFSLSDVSHVFQSTKYRPELNQEFINQLRTYAETCSLISSPTPSLSPSELIDKIITNKILSN